MKVAKYSSFVYSKGVYTPLVIVLHAVYTKIAGCMHACDDIAAYG